MVTVTSVEAQNRFGQLIDGAQREIIIVTRHGRPAAFIVSPRDMEELLDTRRRRSRAVAEMEAWRAEAKRSQSSAQAAAAAQLTDEEVNRLVHE
ncbi:MAG TPA: type II toxin-antitoxin system Phd/YefM family antitoxin [Terracidiphilus sp.]|jgi:prevent-host-death family protein